MRFDNTDVPVISTVSLAEMSHQSVRWAETASTTIAAGVIGVAAGLALGMALVSSSNANPQMYVQPAVHANTHVQPVAAVRQANRDFAPRAQAFPAEATEAAEAMPVPEFHATAQAQVFIPINPDQGGGGVEVRNFSQLSRNFFTIGLDPP